MAFELDFHSLGNPDSSVSVAFVPWDTELFGIPVHELRFDEEYARLGGIVAQWLSDLDRRQGCLVCAKVDEQAVPLLEILANDGFYPVSTVLELESVLAKAIGVTLAPTVPAHLRRAVMADLPAIGTIASSAFWSDRFHLDPNLSSEKASLRYVTWVESAFVAEEPVFVFERDDTGDVVGFYHVRPLSEDKVDLTLGAIDPSLTGRGLGTALFHSTMLACMDLGFEIAQTRIAARNLAVLNVFSRLQWSFCGTKTALHWYEAPADGGRAL